MRRRRLPSVAACLVALLLALPALAQGNPLELAVKATYFYKFAPFATWPATVFAAPDAPVVLCIIGDDPFGSTLEQAVGGQRIGERPIALRRLAQAGRQSGCHIMYMAGSAAQPVAAALSAVRGTPVLTFTDEARGGNAKCIVHFVVRDGRVRFEIDEYAAAENGIVISSKVLSLAVSVRRRS
jgi:hypothetical protein